MKLTDLDREEYKDIVVYTRKDNRNGNLPVYIRREHPHDLSPLHRHEMLQINYVSWGKLIHQINRSRYSLVKGDIFVIPPHIPHQLIAVPGADFEIIELEVAAEFIMGSGERPLSDKYGDAPFFDFYYIEPFLVSECNVKPRLNLSGERQQRVEELLNEIYTEYTQRQDGFLLAIKADILKLLVLVGRYFRENVSRQSDVKEVFDRHHEAIRKAIDYIDRHYTEQISIEEISRVALLSQSYFSYLFKLITNRTFVEYLNSRRLEHAMDLLKNTDQLVADLCYDSGFQNVNHFNRTFKNATGLSPTEYRRANRPGRSGRT